MAEPEEREGYELWRPNRHKSESQMTRLVAAFLFLASAGLAFIITIGGWERLEGGQLISVFYIAVYALFAFLVLRWNRGVLPVGAALAIVLIIFLAIATPGWFDRSGKEAFDSPLIDEELLGLLTLVLIPIQIFLIIAAMIGFNQEWHVEEERPIGSGGSDFGDDEPAPPDEGEPQPQAS